ncbi:MAG: PHP-associated domain-containing protein [Phycisphaerae bacterium]
MKVELHCHTSRYSGCAQATAEEMVQALADAGYGAVFITEHDSVWPTSELAALQEHFPEIRVFPGVELTVGTSCFVHLLVLGTGDRSYLDVKEEKEVVARAKSEGHLTVLAHGFRPEDAPDTARLLDAGWRPDALEYLTGNQDGTCAEEAAKAAGRLGIPLVNAGDLHSLDMVGKFWIDCAVPIVDPDDIREVVLGGKYRNKLSEGV